VREIIMARNLVFKLQKDKYSLNADCTSPWCPDWSTLNLGDVYGVKTSYWACCNAFMCICWPMVSRYGIGKRWCLYLTTTSLQLMSGQTEMWTFCVNLHWSKTSNTSMISRIAATLGCSISPFYLLDIASTFFCPLLKLFYCRQNCGQYQKLDKS